MAFIDKIDVGSASGKLKKLYDAALARAGYVAEIIQVMSRDADVADASMRFYGTLMKSPNALSPARREMLAAVVSNVNDCYYWTLSHARDFGLESQNPETAEKLIYDYRKAELSSEDRALCDFAVKLTKSPGAMSEQDAHSLRSHGWDDDKITIAAQVIGYFNYINRVADGLGVDHEDWMDIPEAKWKEQKADDW